MRRIADILQSRPVYSVKSDMTVLDVAKFMTEKKIGAVPVTLGNTLVGIFSERDLMSRVVVAGKDPAKLRVEEVMTRNLITAGPTEEAQDCLSKMQHAKCRHLPIVEGKKLLGTISLREILQEDLREKVVEIRALADYIHSGPQAQA